MFVNTHFQIMHSIVLSNMASCCVCSSLSFVEVSRDLKDPIGVQQHFDLFSQLQSVRQRFISSAEEGIVWVQVST